MNVFVIELEWLEGNSTLLGVMPADDREKAIEFANQKRRERNLSRFDTIRVILWNMDNQQYVEDVYSC